MMSVPGSGVATNVSVPLMGADVKMLPDESVTLIVPGSGEDVRVNDASFPVVEAMV